MNSILLVAFRNIVQIQQIFSVKAEKIDKSNYFKKTYIMVYKLFKYQDEASFAKKNTAKPFITEK